MSLMSPLFLVFIFILLFIYYIFPKQFRWYVLLASSILFYLIGGGYKAFFYLLVTAFTTWQAALIIERLSNLITEYIRLNSSLTEDIKIYKTKIEQKKKAVCFITVLINLTILGAVKYTGFFARNIINIWNVAANSDVYVPTLNLLVPLGISFYTFQSIGYLIDTYRGQVKAQSNFAKHLLFISYFPQIIQGPIGRYDSLGTQLLSPVPFYYDNLKHGAILMLWGYAKKMVIADRLAPLVITISSSPQNYDGSMIALCVIFYALQLYADFSGGIDIVSGVSEMFGIKLSPNFSRPYFATSLGDFWRRWHISLGSWMRDYVFYPFAMSKGVANIAKKIKRTNKNFAKAFPAMCGNLLVFTLVGIWHGAEWRYVVWGIYNGIILAIDVVLTPFYARFYKIFPNLKKNKIWTFFQMIRTFLIVCIGFYTDVFTDVVLAVHMLFKTLFDFHIIQLTPSTFLRLGMGRKGYLILAISIIMLFIISALQEKGVKIREWLDRQCILIQWILLYGLIFFVIFSAVITSSDVEAFMYANF